MSRRQKINWKLIIMTPLTVAAAVFGIWVATTAAHENFRVVRMTNQMLAMLSFAPFPIARGPHAATRL